MTGIPLPVHIAVSEAFVREAMALAAEAGVRGDEPFGALLVNPSGAVVRERRISRSPAMTRPSSAGPIRAASQVRQFPGPAR